MKKAKFNAFQRQIRRFKGRVSVIKSKESGGFFIDVGKHQVGFESKKGDALRAGLSLRLIKKAKDADDLKRLVKKFRKRLKR